MSLKANDMHSLPDFFKTIPDPHQAQGRRHSLPTDQGQLVNDIRLIPIYALYRGGI